MATTTLVPRTPHAWREEDRTFLDPQSDGDLLATARQRFTEVEESWREDRAQQAQAARFLAGEQWSDEALALRNVPGQAKRPAFVIPLQHVYVRQVVNAWRASPQSMRIRPNGGEASQETAQMLEGYVRNIEQESQALIAYTTALEHAVSTGEGFFRLNLEYADPYSFRQEIRIGAIPDRFSVYLDPAAKHPCGLGAEFGFIIEEMSWSKFCYQYKIDQGELELWHVQDRQRGGAHWITHNSVQVAEYFYRVWDEVTICEMANGQVYRKEYLGEEPEDIVQERVTRLPTVHWAKLTGAYVLEKTRWLGQYIPLIRVPGDTQIYDGKTRHTGMTQPSMDAQSSYNYFVSAQTEAIGMTPKAPYLVTPRQISGFEGHWNRANDASLPYLLWNPEVLGTNMLVPPPQRQVVEPAVQAISQARGMSAADVQSTTGMFGPSIGEPSNEKSGVAIQERRGESNQTNASYAANMGWALETCGKQTLDLIKALHDTPQTLRTVGMDGKVDHVRVNQPIQAGPTGQQQPHWLQAGSYDAICDSGPSYTSQREMAAERLGDLGKALPPELLVLVADLWVGSLDIPYASEIAARLKTVVPAEALAASEQKDPETLLAQMQNQVAQVTAQMQQMQQQLQESTQLAEVSKQQLMLTEQRNATLETRLADKSEDNQLEAQKQQQDYTIELAKLKLEEQRLYFEMQQAQREQNAEAA